MAKRKGANNILQVDPTLKDIPTFGCVYCAHMTGCYDCRGHGVIGINEKSGRVIGLEPCKRCLSSCTACAFMRNLVLKLVGGRK